MKIIRSMNRSTPVLGRSDVLQPSGIRQTARQSQFARCCTRDWRAPVRGFNARIYRGNLSSSRRAAGVMLIECLVYIAVFAILLGVGTAAFFLCWDQSKAIVYATDDIGAALRAGERWRADVRNATGEISIQQSAEGELVRIPEREKAVVYRFESGEVRREVPASQTSQLLLPHVKTSQMSMELRDNVAAWRWELDLVVRRPETQLPLLFTFETVQTKP